MKFISSIVGFSLFILISFSAFAEEATYIRNNLNRNFAGQLVQPGSKMDGKDVLITLKSVKTDKNGYVTATGHGKFFSHDKEEKSFNFSWRINPDTLHFEMREKSGSMPYVGNISKGLDSIEAIQSDKKGKLILYAIVQLDP